MNKNILLFVILAVALGGLMYVACNAMNVLPMVEVEEANLQWFMTVMINWLGYLELYAGIFLNTTFIVGIYGMLLSLKYKCDYINGDHVPLYIFALYVGGALLPIIACFMMIQMHLVIPWQLAIVLLTLFPPIYFLNKKFDRTRDLLEVIRHET